ncbi:MAG: 3-oxoacyl-ACP synthase [Coxiella sp. DG_40]|nr:MAG: 3-oxoacyl-ACP synthase [Coxiella sp. DG_40]
MTKRRVVITGLGAVSPLGLNVTDTWNAVLKGKSGVKPITSFDASEFSVKIAAFVENFDPTLYMDQKDIRKTDHFIQFAIAAVSQAIEDANLEINEDNAHRIGIIIGSGIGGLPIIERTYRNLIKGGPRKISPHFIPSSIINMAPGLISIKYGLKGPSYSIVSACATGAHNIGDAARMISYGDADVMLAGGTEMATTPIGVGGFAAARALSRRNDEPELASRPWDKDRDGFVLGDGAAVIVLEEYEYAKKRGANIYAELIGFGMSSDAFHITAPDETGMGSYYAMQNTLHDAKLNPEDINYINAHGTSTIAGDIVEAIAIKKLFGDQAYKTPISSTKSMTGHMLGAAGAIEAIFSVLTIRDQIAPPTINLFNPDEKCDLDFIPHTARELNINVVLSNSLGFGGTNCALLFKKI